eukprot:Opistho-2@61897
MKVSNCIAAVLVACCLVQLASGKVLPIAIMHGISASASSLDFMAKFIAEKVPGIYVKNLEVGNGDVDSFFMPMEKQVDSLCRQLKEDTNLAGGFNLLGVSQGGLVARGYLERCNDPPVHTFISWVSPQAGQYGVPIVNDACNKVTKNATYCELLDDIFNKISYAGALQAHVTFAEYWKDPFALTEYATDSRYLADINNERGLACPDDDTACFRGSVNATYKNNMLALENFLLIHSAVDDTLVPMATSAWGFYAPGDLTQIIPLEDSYIYRNDVNGLRTLDATGRLRRFTTMCAHADYSSECFQKYFGDFVVPFLSKEV